MAKTTLVLTVIAMALLYYVHGGTVEFRHGKIHIKCEGNTLEKFGRVRVDHTESEVLILQCSPPKDTYAAVFRSIGLDVAAIRRLNIYNIPEGSHQLYDSQFTDLSLSSLFITSRLIAITYNLFGGKVDLAEANNVALTCLDNRTLTDMPEVLPGHIVRVSVVEVRLCPIPQDTYATALRGVGINVAAISHLMLSLLSRSKNLFASHFADISLRVLTIIWPHKDRQLFNIQILVMLASFLEELNVANTILPSLPKTRLINVSLSYGKSLGKWDNCNNLRKLSILEWQVPEDKWLVNCSQLEQLELRQLQAQSLSRALIGVASVTQLHVISCEIGCITKDLLSNAGHLLKLELSENIINRIHEEAFSKLVALQTLQLKDNLFMHIQDLRAALKPLKALHSLEITQDMLDFSSDVTSSLKLPLKKLSVTSTGMQDLCFGRWDTLEYLNLRNCAIWNFKLNGFMLPSPRDHSLLVDLSDNKISSMPDTKEDSDLMVSDFKQATNITILVTLELDCDCQHGWFGRALRSLSGLRMIGARCSTGEELGDIQPNRLECNKTICEGCVCRRSWDNNDTVADCSDMGMRIVPPLSHIPNLRSLLASDNMITTLRADIFTSTLLVVDFRVNYISRINADVVQAMFREPKRNVSLSGNPFICNCDNEPLLSALQAHRYQVMDYDNLTCAGNTLQIRHVDVKALCKEKRERQLLEGAAIGCSLLTVASLAFIACYRYWCEIKIFLFARGWCLCCVRELELDADRPYDAFISFTNDDDLFVTENLLPELNRDYSLCMHTRDWMPGELITTQVFRSVEQSRRTIIVLSRSFVSSYWGMLEFRTAHTSALSEGRVRVIVIVLDDFEEYEQLDPDLRRYLRTNTYLKWGDPWFWQKLRYAMPHQQPQLHRRVLHSNREPHPRVCRSESTLL